MIELPSIPRANVKRAYGIEGVYGGLSKRMAHHRAERFGPYAFAQDLKIDEPKEINIVTQVPEPHVDVA